MSEDSVTFPLPEGPASHADAEERRRRKAARPAISLIAADIPGFNLSLYVGGAEAASDPRLMRAHGIGIIINCAVNLDINFEAAPTGADGRLAYGPGLLRYYKLGLVDDAGNPDAMLVAGYYLLLGALGQTVPQRSSYPHRDTGNVLINCRAGRSRAVTLAALFLHLQMRDAFPTLETAIDHVRDRRALHPDEWFETPKPELIGAAARAAAMIGRLEGEIA